MFACDTAGARGPGAGGRGRCGWGPSGASPEPERPRCPLCPPWVSGVSDALAVSPGPAVPSLPGLTLAQRAAGSRGPGRCPRCPVSEEMLKPTETPPTPHRVPPLGPGRELFHVRVKGVGAGQLALPARVGTSPGPGALCGRTSPAPHSGPMASPCRPSRTPRAPQAPTGLALPLCKADPRLQDSESHAYSSGAHRDP